MHREKYISSKVRLGKCAKYCRKVLYKFCNEINQMYPSLYPQITRLINLEKKLKANRKATHLSVLF